MSGTTVTNPALTSFSTDTLTEYERTAVRNYCGYGSHGSNLAGFNDYLYYQFFGQLEYRMNNLSGSEYQQVRGYLTDIIALETALDGASATLMVDTAAVFVRNKNELTDRTRLQDAFRHKLLNLLQVPPGPWFGGSGNSMRLVV